MRAARTQTLNLK